jgi:hypothetical protein|tara:strand:- start:31 stop:636 length:606 start_codon:yes stop_codon:yes gene_type:complete
MQDMMIQYWQFVVVALVIVVAIILRVVFGVSEKRHKGINFKVTDGMPEMKPITIPTAGKGFFGAIWMWLTGTRKWELTKDFTYKIDRRLYIIPKGFVFDGASIPKFLRSWLSPVGVLLIGGLVHDYGYKYETLRYSASKGKEGDPTIGTKDQKWMDETFRDINIKVNGFYALNYLAYYSLRLAGFVAWNGHRKRDLKWDGK